MSYKIIRWDICVYLHAMNDFGYKAPENPSAGYSRSSTYSAECYKYRDNGFKFDKKKDCRERCIVPILEKEN